MKVKMTLEGDLAMTEEERNEKTPVTGFWSGMFKDDAGNMSSTRMLSFGAFLAAVLLIVLELFFDANSENLHYYIMFFLGAAFAPKTIQKFAEKMVERK